MEMVKGIDTTVENLKHQILCAIDNIIATLYMNLATILLIVPSTGTIKFFYCLIYSFDHLYPLDDTISPTTH